MAQEIIEVLLEKIKIKLNVGFKLSYKFVVLGRCGGQKVVWWPIRWNGVSVIGSIFFYKRTLPDS